MSSTPRLRGAGLGAGYFARYQYEAWTRIPEVQIDAIYNRTESKAREMMASYGVPRYYAEGKTHALRGGVRVERRRLPEDPAGGGSHLRIGAAARSDRRLRGRPVRK